MVWNYYLDLERPGQELLFFGWNPERIVHMPTYCNNNNLETIIWKKLTSILEKCTRIYITKNTSSEINNIKAKIQTCYI